MAAGNGNWTDLRARVISAAVIIPVALGCIVAGGVFFDVMIGLVTVGMAWEGLALSGMTVAQTPRWRLGLLLAWPVVAFAAALKGEWRAALGVAAAGFIFGPAAWLMLCVVIVGSLSLLWLRHLPSYGLDSVLFVIVVVVASDSGAYVAGRLFGGPKLAPRISPGKTRSGAIGGLFCAALVGGGLAGVVSGASWPGGLFYGALLGVAAQAGDLAESAAKRRVGVKDSGTIIPGHGGLLDRFDALLAAAPLAALVSLAAPGRPFWSARIADMLHALTGFGAS